MKHRPEPVDLSALDPESDPERVERVVRGVMARLGPGELVEGPSLAQLVAGELAGRSRAVVAVAAVIALVAGAWLGLGRRRVAAAPDAGAVTVRVPAEWAVWMTSGTRPAAGDILFDLAGGQR